MIAGTRGRRPEWLIWFAPALLGMVFIQLIPVIDIVRLSFTDFTLFGGGDFVGLANYRRLIHAPAFWRAALNNAILMVTVPASIVTARTVALRLLRQPRGANVYRVLIMLPLAVPLVAAGALFLHIFSFDGPVNGLLALIGLEHFARAWISDPYIGILAVAFVIVWKQVAFFLLLFTARLADLDPALLDAAAVDGCTWRQAMAYVVRPQMRRVGNFMVILGTINVLAYSFTVIFVLGKATPPVEIRDVGYMLYDAQFYLLNLSLSATLGVMLLIVAVGVAILRIATQGLTGIEGKEA